MYSVLYVDDEENLLEIGKIFLEEKGDFTVDTSVSAIDAMKMIRTRFYDAIVSDYQMPRMNGIEFLKQVRRTFGNIPFILFTGKGREEVVIQAINNGADFYLQKGGDPTSQFAELDNNIRIAVERRRAVDALVESEQRLADIINFLPDATFAIDTTGVVIAWNRAIEEMTGVSAPGMLGKGDHEYAIPFYDERRPILIDLILETEDKIGKRDYTITKKERDVLIAETAAAHPQGLKKILSGKASLLYNKNGAIVGAIESIRDITETKRAEEELRAAYEQISATEEELRAQYNTVSKNEKALQESQEELRESEKLFREVFSNANDAITLVENISEGPGRFLLVNDKTTQLLGYTRGELLQKSPKDLVPVKIMKKIQPDAITKIFRDGEAIFESEYLRKDGSNLPVEVSIHRFWYQGKDVALGIIRDITERKQVQQNMQNTITFLNALIDQNPNALWISDEKGFLIRMNAACSRLLHISEEELAGNYNIFDDNIVEEQGFMPLIKSVFEEGRVVSFPLIYDSSRLDAIKLKETVSLVLGVTIFPIKNTEGKFTNAVIIHDDITKRKRAEDAIRESEERYRLILKNANDGILVNELTPKGPGKFIDANDQACRVLGMTREEMKNVSLIDLDTPEMKKRASWILQEIITNKHTVFQTNYWTKDLQEKIIDISVSLFDLNGRPTMLSVVRDITERKHAEEAVQQANRQLNLMTSITRHDLLNKIIAMQSYLVAAKRKFQTPEILAFIEKLESVTKSMKSQIEFTRVYQDLGTHEPQWQSADKIVSGIEIPSSITLHSSLKGEEIYADPLFEKVFDNLLDNTLRHGEKVTKISVSCHQTSMELVLVWEDNGVGVPVSEKDQIFERGFGKNNGLGLFLVREILATTGISVRETGIKGQGARFEILVPKGKYRCQAG